MMKCANHVAARRRVLHFFLAARSRFVLALMALRAWPGGASAAQ
jgi:hypothetical protein